MLRLCRVFVSRQRTCQLLVLLLALGLATTASAQGERGVIIGTVADAQGGVLPGVTDHGSQRRYRLHPDGRDRRRRSVPVRGAAAGQVRAESGAGRLHDRHRDEPRNHHQPRAPAGHHDEPEHAAGIGHRDRAGAGRRGDQERSLLGHHAAADRDAAGRQPRRGDAGAAPARHEPGRHAAAPQQRAGRRRHAAVHEQQPRGRHDEHVHQGRRAAAGLPAGGHPGIQGVHQPGAGRIRRARGRRHQRRDQERHERLQRRRLRVPPQQGDEQGRQVHAGGGRRGSGHRSVQPATSSAGRSAARS